MAKTFILSDDSVNSYGTRVLTAGLSLKQFKANPVMLFNHRSYGDSYSGPIGRWTNIRVEEGKLMADAEFDSSDDFAKKIEAKVEAGFIKAASIGINILAVSEEPQHLVAGQTRPTITKAMLFEASVVDLPANYNALALYDQSGELLQLSATNSIEKFLPKISTMEKLNLTAATLGKLQLKDTATAQEVEVAVDAMHARTTTLEQEIAQLKKANATALVATAIKEKRITDADREQFETLALSDYALAQTTLAAIPPKVLPAQGVQLSSGSNAGDDRETWTFKDWSQKDPAGLAKMKSDDPEAYKLMAARSLQIAKTKR